MHIVSCISLVDAECEGGWFEHDDRCYYVSGGEYHQNYASSRCASRDATLAIVDNKAENDFLVNL